MTVPRPGEPEVVILPDPEAVSVAAAQRIAAALRDGARRRGRADWATTGGSTPAGIYRALLAPPLRDAVPWDAVHVWWGDDRFVPRGHPLSNALPFDQVLGEASLDLRPEHVHAPPMTQAIAEDRDPAWVASAYARELRAAGLPQGDAGFPILDVMLVGVGPDGHVLSVFPDSELFESDHWVAGVPAPTHVEPHVARISLNPAILTVAALPVVVAHGAAKAEVIASVLEGDLDPRRLPAQLARRSGAAWFLDAAAAARLHR